MAERQIGTLIDRKKMEIVLQRIKDGKVPLFMEKKPAPEKPMKKASDKPKGKPAVITLSTGTITPLLNKKAGEIIKTAYIWARDIAAASGLQLPSNALHDDYLVYSQKWKTLDKQGYYPAWAREILAYPEKDGIFTSGRDIVDSKTKWVIPANYVPQIAFGIKGVGLFIDPEIVRKENGRMIVHPNSIVVLNGLLQKDGRVGKVYPATRVPLEIDARLLAKLPDKEKRWFWRISGVGVRPVARDYYFLVNRRSILCDCDPGSGFGVGGA
jgi:hypothetical protein